MNKVRHAAQRGFEFFWCFCRDPRAESARRHIDKTGFIIDLHHIYFNRIAGDGQLQGFIQNIRNTHAGGEVIAVPSGKIPSAGISSPAMDERGGDFVDGAITAARNDGGNAQLAGLINVTPGVAFFPCDAHMISTPSSRSRAIASRSGDYQHFFHSGSVSWLGMLSSCCLTFIVLTSVCQNGFMA